MKRRKVGPARRAGCAVVNDIVAAGLPSEEPRLKEGTRSPVL